MQQLSQVSSFLSYSNVNKIIKEYKSSRKFQANNKNEELKLIEPTGIVADVIKNYWITTGIWFLTWYS